jgi:polysaccharide transporter, PST family
LKPSFLHSSNLIDKLNKYQNVISNLGYLTVLQILNLVLPIISYPYLIITLGDFYYGQIIYVQALVSFLVILINFGFNITATKEISIHRENKEKLNQIVSSIFILKALLLLVSFLVLFLFLSISDSNSYTNYLYLLTMWMCLYEFLFPIWYFQGIEQMKYITIFSVVSKSLFLALIFIIVQAPNDYLMVPLINGIGATISCVLALLILHKHEIKITLQKRVVLIQYIKKSYVMALAYGANVLKSNFSIVIIKYFFSYSSVAYFDLALKVVNIGISFLDLISQSIYPMMVKNKNSTFLKKVLKYSVIVAFIVTVITQIMSSTIIKVLGGNNMNLATPLLEILALIFPIYIVGALLGRNCLLVHGKDRIVLKSMVLSSVVYIASVLIISIIIPEVNLKWIAFAYIVSFLIEGIYRYYECKKLKFI